MHEPPDGNVVRRMRWRTRRREEKAWGRFGGPTLARVPLMRVASSAAHDLRGGFHEIAFYGLHPSGRQVGGAVGGKGRRRFQ